MKKKASEIRRSLLVRNPEIKERHTTNLVVINLPNKQIKVRTSKSIEEFLKDFNNDKNKRDKKNIKK